MDWNYFLYGAMPYILVLIAIVGAIYRFKVNKFSWSSQSSQFLENKILFFGSFPWHYGIVLLLLGHIIGALFPSWILAWNGTPVRLYILELTALSLGLLALFGLVLLIYRRLTNPRVKAVTSTWDVLVLIVLLIQVVSGVGTAIFYRWGSNWYAAAAVPWMWSLFKLNPNAEYIANLPLLAKVHVFNAMVFIGLIPFSRLAHFAVIRPYKYLARPYQVVNWYRRGPVEEVVPYK